MLNISILLLNSGRLNLKETYPNMSYHIYSKFSLANNNSFVGCCVPQYYFKTSTRSLLDPVAFIASFSHESPLSDQSGVDVLRKLGQSVFHAYCSPARRRGYRSFDSRLCYFWINVQRVARVFVL